MKKLDFNGTQTSVIGLGCMRMADLSPKQADTIIKTAIDCDIDFFDHADIYGAGECERKFGAVLRDNPGLREKVFIQSKCAIRPGLYDFSEKHILQSVDGILNRLGTDHLDSLLLHRPDALMEPEEVNKAFETLHKAGKVRAFGLSNMNRFQIELLQSGLKFPILADQLQMSLAHSPMIDEGINVNTAFPGAVSRSSGTLEYCRLKGIIVQTWSPLQKGFFQGPFIKDPDYADLVKVLKDMTAKTNSTIDAVAYAWLLRYPAKMQVIVGTMNPEHIRSAAKASDIELSREEWYALYRAAGNELP